MLLYTLQKNYWLTSSCLHYMTTIATKPYDLQLHVCIGIVSFISEHMQTRSTLVKNGDGCQQLAWNWSQDFVCIFSLLLPQWCLVTEKEMVTGPLQHAAVVFAAISKISDSYNSEQLGNHSWEGNSHRTLLHQLLLSLQLSQMFWGS